ncbi:MAG: hypothetical protein IIB38_16395 [Candidatus Hydrogenedentes bacterium]|nr:hypothetical protein [Candidatus Hydrogenedentota bacterium]
MGQRISWNLRPTISEKIDAKAIKAGKQVESWQQRRKNMQNVCGKCHSDSYVDGFYIQFDSAINLYNEKYGMPTTKIIKLMKAGGVLTPTAFDEKLEWTYFYLWHHEGRRARHGASMMAPDYTHWHGMYEVAKTFYTHYVPELQDLVKRGESSGDPEKVAAAEKLAAKLDAVLNSENHRWYLGKMDPSEAQRRRKAAEDFKARYNR